MEVNLKYLAKLAGVSVSTVSRALRGDPRVKPATKDRIKELAERMNYMPNQSAVGLVTGKTKTIGLILPNIRAFMHDIFDGIEGVCSSIGYNILLGVSNNDSDKEIKEVKLLLQKRVDGIILFHIGGMYDHRVARVVKDANIPTVFIDRTIPGALFDCVVNNNQLGSELLVNHFFEQGHRKIAFIYEIEDCTTLRERIDGYKTAMLKRGTPAWEAYLVTTKEFRKRENGFASMKRLAEMPNPPTAVIGSTGDDLFGMTQYILENPNLKGKFSLAGFDNEDYLDIIGLPVASLELQETAVGVKAAEILRDRISGDDGPVKRITLDPILVLRKG